MRSPQEFYQTVLLEIQTLLYVIDATGRVYAARNHLPDEGLWLKVQNTSGKRFADSSLPTRRRAVVTLEAIIWLPVLVIVLLAVVEMGLIMVGAMHVAAASRLGAKIAAESPNLDTTTVAVAANVRSAVDTYFESAGYGTTASAGVRIQHNIGGGGSVEDGTCPEKNDPPLPSILLPTRAVRVVVCLPVTVAAPNMLQTFGFNTASMTLDQFTTYPYEGITP